MLVPHGSIRGCSGRCSAAAFRADDPQISDAKDSKARARRRPGLRKKASPSGAWPPRRRRVARKSGSENDDDSSAAKKRKPKNKDEPPAAERRRHALAGRPSLDLSARKCRSGRPRPKSRSRSASTKTRSASSPKIGGEACIRHAVFAPKPAAPPRLAPLGRKLSSASPAQARDRWPARFARFHAG